MWERRPVPIPPHSSVGKESACNAGDPGSIPGLGICPGEGSGNPLQYSCLGSPMDRRPWQATVHGVTRGRQDLATKKRERYLGRAVLSLSYAFPVEATAHSHSLRISYSRFSGTFYQLRTLPSMSILLLLTAPENWIHGFAPSWHIARVLSLIWGWIFPFCDPNLAKQSIPILPMQRPRAELVAEPAFAALRKTSLRCSLLLPGTQVTQ